jgi:hypothetical protein
MILELITGGLELITGGLIGFVIGIAVSQCMYEHKLNHLETLVDNIIEKVQREQKKGDG